MIGALSWHRNSRDLGFSIASARSPSDVYSLDADDRRGHALDRERDSAAWTPRSLSEPELIRWKSFDGREISGFLYKPPAALHRASAR